MKRNHLLLLLLITCSINVMAQTDFYYYYGKKMPLILNENKVCVTIPKTCDGVLERFRANVQTLCNIKDETFETNVILWSEYEKLISLDFWAEDTKSVIVTSSYFTQRNEEVYESPYLDVKLKKPDDVDILTSFIEQHKLKIARVWERMPLWYTLHITPDSNMGSVECANALYESGKFTHAVPDLVLTESQYDATAIRNITTMPTAERPSKIFNLSGRRITVTPTRGGVYIKDGRKVMVK